MEIDPRELYWLHRVDDMGKGTFKFVFRSYDQVKVGKHMQRKCFELHRGNESEAWNALKERLEKDLEESVDM